VLAAARTEMIDLNVLTLSSNGLRRPAAWPLRPDNDFDGPVRILRKQFFEEVATVNEGKGYFIAAGAAGRKAGAAAGADSVVAG
jgi:hypothetical protein